MSLKLSEHEIEVMRMLRGDFENTPLAKTWGAWVGACIEFLQEDGLVTRGSTWRLTEKGENVLQGISPKI